MLDEIAVDQVQRVQKKEVRLYFSSNGIYKFLQSSHNYTNGKWKIRQFGKTMHTRICIKAFLNVFGIEKACSTCKKLLFIAWKGPTWEISSTTQRVYIHPLRPLCFPQHVVINQVAPPLLLEVLGNGKMIPF